ncbi:uncharacterized protein LOC142334981 [Convolutriloba macropyga]|uniref:uncharacterized protein LOC142334981 n=1 Tax=Convolutriloba macropyga TaxID=536237 RepID=UPI003F524C40
MKDLSDTSDKNLPEEDKTEAEKESKRRTADLSASPEEANTNNMGKSYNLQNASVKNDNNIIQKSVTSKDDSGEAIKILTTEDSNLPPNEKGEVGQMSMDINDTPKLGWKAPLVYLKIFKFASVLDIMLLIVGIVASILTGVALPVLIILFAYLEI